MAEVAQSVTPGVRRRADLESEGARGATDCIAGANTGSSELLSTSRGEIDAAFAERGQANARLKIINGN
jgi:hypothetical protein